MVEGGGSQWRTAADGGAQIDHQWRTLADVDVRRLTVTDGGPRRQPATELRRLLPQVVGGLPNLAGVAGVRRRPPPSVAVRRTFHSRAINSRMALSCGKLRIRLLMRCWPTSARHPASSARSRGSTERRRMSAFGTTLSNAWRLFILISRSLLKLTFMVYTCSQVFA